MDKTVSFDELNIVKSKLSTMTQEASDRHTLTMYCKTIRSELRPFMSKLKHIDSEDPVKVSDSTRRRIPHILESRHDAAILGYILKHFPDIHFFCSESQSQC